MPTVAISGSVVPIGAGAQIVVDLLDPATGRTRHVTASGLSGKIRDLDWSRDGKHLAFTATTPSGTALWVADVASGTARRLTGPTINFTTGRGNIVDDPGCSWLNGKAPLVCRLWPANRGALPKVAEVPTGVIVQESYGRSAPVRTYEYLLQSPTDEALFDYYFTDQLSLVGLDGKITPIGPPGIHVRATPSPDVSMPVMVVPVWMAPPRASQEISVPADAVAGMREDFRRLVTV